MAFLRGGLKGSSPNADTTDGRDHITERYWYPSVRTVPVASTVWLTSMPSRHTVACARLLPVVRVPWNPHWRGLFFFPMCAVGAIERVALFIDYQNAYRRARDAFHPVHESSHTAGQFDPLTLGQLIVSKGGPHRQLAGVHVYRGMPDSTRDPKGYGACRRQVESWRKADPCVQVFTRPLRYLHGRVEEKGVDVALAVDFVMTLYSGHYDTGVLMSADTDLKPALEAVVSMHGTPYPRCEVACWRPPDQHARRLSIPAKQIWCHFLDKSDYQLVADQRDYTVK